MNHFINCMRTLGFHVNEVHLLIYCNLSQTWFLLCTLPYDHWDEASDAWTDVEGGSDAGADVEEGDWDSAI